MPDPSLFELNNIDSFVQDEFKRRSKDIGFDYKPSYSPLYRGPKAAWVRVCSNTKIDGLDGFVMYGVNGFDDTFGFRNDIKGTVLGYDVTGKEHTVKEDMFKHRPAPGVTGLEVELQGGAGKFRKTTIKWQCWSSEHLDYLENYFLIPTVSLFVEWGWNNFDPSSLLNLNDVLGLIDFVQKEDWIRNNLIKSGGNWDMSYGIITDFNYTLREDGGYDVSTTISNPSSLYTAFSTKDNRVRQDGTEKVSIKEFFDIYFPSIIDKSAVGTKKFEGLPMDGVKDKVFCLSKGVRKPSNHYELFNSNNQESWMTFGFVIDIINFFYSKKDSKNGIKFLEIDVSDTVICAHKNLKSTDSSILLIPNSSAPSGEVIGSDTNSLSPMNQELSSENVKLLQSGLSTKRVNLASIICEQRKGFEFPNYNVDSDGNAGYLKDLYVNSKFVKEVVLRNEYVSDALKEILDGMSKAACGIWDFNLGPRDIYSTTTLITIRDKNYIGKKSYDELIKDSGIYSFNLVSAESFVKNSGFSVKPSSAVTMQALMVNNSKDSIYITPKNWIEYRSSDRMQGKLVQAEVDTKPASRTSADGTKRDLTDKTGPEYAVVKVGNENIRLCEPDEALQKQLIIDNNPNNNAIYNSIMPNTQLDITIQGISGLKFLDCFSVSNGLPKTYSKDNALYQITNVKHSLRDGNWSTTINAGIRPKPNFLNNTSK